MSQTVDRDLDVDAFIDDAPMGPFQVRVVAVATLVVVLDGLDAQIVGLVAPAISEQLKIPLGAFGPVFAAGLIGILIGAMSLGPLADRVGRRWTIIGSTAAFGGFTILTGLSASVGELILWRFLTGIGLGGALPNLVALATEFAPRRLQFRLVAWMFAGIPVGAVVGALLTTAVVPVHGWAWAFYIGGGIPLAVSIVLVGALPESVRFLVGKGHRDGDVRNLLSRIHPGADLSSVSISARSAVKRAVVPVVALFSDGRALGTVLLWVPYFMNLLMLYFFVSWMPAVMKQAGGTLNDGAFAIVAFSVGGAFGSVLTGAIVQNLGARRVLASQFLAAIALFAGFSLFYDRLSVVLLLAPLLGFALQGAQAGLNGLVAEFYPTAIRSSGIGWAVGVGRLGSIIGPVVGGWFIAFELPLWSIFLTCIIPSVLSAGAIIAITYKFSGRLEY